MICATVTCSIGVGVGIQRLNLHIETPVRRRQDGEALRLKVGGSGLPAARTQKPLIKTMVPGES